MSEISIRKLRKHGGRAVDQVMQGETLLVTRDGVPVAELRPLPRANVNITTILERWQKLPHLEGLSGTSDDPRGFLDFPPLNERL